jgi:hypothetical protein
VDQPVTKPATIFLLGLENEDKARRLAQQIAEKMGREIEIRDSNGDLIVAVRPTQR